MTRTDFNEYIYNREQKEAYKIFAENALIDIILRKNKQIKELLVKINELQNDTIRIQKLQHNSESGSNV
jgi:hypothetical protein